MNTKLYEMKEMNQDEMMAINGGRSGFFTGTAVAGVVTFTYWMGIQLGEKAKKWNSK